MQEIHEEVKTTEENKTVTINVKHSYSFFPAVCIGWK